MKQYLEIGLAELVTAANLQKLPKEVLYLPMQAVRKEHSTTTKIWTV